ISVAIEAKRELEGRAEPAYFQCPSVCRWSMTIFQLKQLASSSIHAATDAIRWNYDRVEIIADGVVHAIGILCGLIAATVLVVLTAVYASTLYIVAVSIYVAGLLSML